MQVAGIDLSTKAIDLVLLDLDTDNATWTRYNLAGPDLIDKVQSVRRFGPTWSTWDDVLAVGIERPIGRFNPGPLNMICGALLTRIPKEKLVKLWTPPAWKKASLGKGNATKDEVREWACAHGLNGDDWDWPQDAFDAHCIAYATRAAIETLAPSGDNTNP